MAAKPPPKFKSGFVALLGAPNVGKSTLLNRLLGQKLSITSSKPQTTRNRILGIIHRPDAQLVFLDTPGIHRADKPLNKRIVEIALAVMQDADLILMLVDASRQDPDSEKLLLRFLKKKPRTVILALNKIDRIPKPDLLKQIRDWSERHPFHGVIPISAKYGDQVPVLVDAMIGALPAGPPLYPEDMVTDLPMRFVAAELIREKVFRLTGQEIPYAAAVTVDAFERQQANQTIVIHATVHVERDSQKGIVIGKKGMKLKQIGEAARKDIEEMAGASVFLKLFVRVQKNWSRDTKAIRRFGY